MTRLGGVPIKVIIPPILLANANGMSRRLAFMFALKAKLTTIGNIRATVPVLLTNAPIAAVTSITRMNSFSSLLPAILNIFALIILANPV